LSNLLGPEYDNGKQNWRILTDKEIYAIIKKPTVTETVRLYRLCWFGDGQRTEGNRIPKSTVYEFENKTERQTKK
jgi:hypothetical protein